MQRDDNYRIVVEGRHASKYETNMTLAIDGVIGITDFYQVAKVMMRAFLDRPGRTMTENTYILGLIAWLKDDKRESVVVDITEAKKQAERREASAD